jgi:hypothetical protein
LKLSTAPPNPVTDNTSDDDKEEENTYKFPDFDKIPEDRQAPYWHAFPKETKRKMKEHDHLELNVLGTVRDLDFKLREAWTKTDKPFAASN